MTAKRKKYTAEFKLQAIRLMTDKGLSSSEAAEQLGISPGLLRNWKAEHDKQGKAAFQGPAPLSAAEQELRSLREENQRLRTERDILKKAAAYFAAQFR